ncbi:hypothetical protein [Streptomyces sp. WAC00288]|uniref:hypothetical protein n=1 Tax=Streptomyces sp. WAC00288 TaxID=2094021 RepID=UPI00131CF0CF|nr:hypothetical protein [Streptomyces sp. WAC00288]
MAEAKKTSPARKTAAVKKTAAAKATAEKPAPGASGGADSAPFVADVPSVPGEDPKPPVDLGAELSAAVRADHRRAAAGRDPGQRDGRE